MTAAGEQLLSARAADTVASVTGPADRTGAQLAAAFPPRPVVASWPVTEDVIAGVLAFHARQRDREPAAPPTAGYRAESLQILFGDES